MYVHTRLPDTAEGAHHEQAQASRDRHRRSGVHPIGGVRLWCTHPRRSAVMGKHRWETSPTGPCRASQAARSSLFGVWATLPVHLRSRATHAHPSVMPVGGTDARPPYGFGSRGTRWSLTMRGQLTNHDEARACLDSVGSCTAMTLQPYGSACTRGRALVSLTCNRPLHDRVPGRCGLHQPRQHLLDACGP